MHRGQRIPLTHAGPLAVSEDGTHWAVATYDTVTGKDRVLVDGTEVFVGHTPSELIVGRDGRAAFVALVHPLKGTRRVHVTGRKPGPTVEGAEQLRFTASGDVRYIALRGGYTGPSGTSTSVDTLTTRGTAYESIEPDVATLGDDRAFYIARRLAKGSEDSAVVVVGTREHGPYARVYEHARAGTRTAWVAEVTKPSSTGPTFALRVVLDGKTVFERDLGVRSPMGDRGPDAAGLALHPGSDELAFGLARSDGTGFELHVTKAGAAAVATGVQGEPIAYDDSGEHIALLAFTDDRRQRRVRVARRPFDSVIDGPPLDEIFVSTLRFDPSARVVRYFAMEGNDLVRIEQRLR